MCVASIISHSKSGSTTSYSNNFSQIPGLVLGVGLAGPLTQMDSYDVRLRAAREAAARIGEFLATPVLPVPDAPAAAEGGEVVLDDVSFEEE